MSNDRYLSRGLTYDNKWVIGYYTPALDYQLEYITQIENFSPSNYQEEGDCVPRFKQVAIYERTVGQCTGLKDKNDKLIFEGDIIRAVHWCGDMDEATCLNKAEIPGIYLLIAGGKDYGINESTIEIIGNIHQNSELLEATK